MFLKSLSYILLALSLLSFPLRGEAQQLHELHFPEVSADQFVRHVGRLTGKQFIYDAAELQFLVRFDTAEPISSEKLLQAMIKILKVNGLSVKCEDDYWVISRAVFVEELPEEASHQFYVHKLQYHEGAEIEAALKKLASELKGPTRLAKPLIEAIQSLHWVKPTNSLVFSGTAEALASLQQLISDLDQPLKQVFIEILVVETDARKTSDFGLDWAAGGELLGKVGAGLGQLLQPGTWPEALQKGASRGLSQLPMRGPFELGVIGDLIRHKGNAYLTLGALVSALQSDGDASIVLNQKIITQDNKNSKIFCGDNIPYTDSVVQTVGVGQQTTAHVNYRDVGVSLSITPILGDQDVITLHIEEEISESLGDLSTQNAHGIHTTKTHMVTDAHVPDRHFLVLSGMMRNATSVQKAGLPCLGGIPYLGSLFGKTKRSSEKRSVIIFVRPHIVRSMDEYRDLSQKMEAALPQQ